MNRRQPDPALYRWPHWRWHRRARRALSVALGSNCSAYSVEWWPADAIALSGHALECCCLVRCSADSPECSTLCKCSHVIQWPNMNHNYPMQGRWWCLDAALLRQLFCLYWDCTHATHCPKCRLHRAVSHRCSLQSSASAAAVRSGRDQRHACDSCRVRKFIRAREQTKFNADLLQICCGGIDFQQESLFLIVRHPRIAAEYASLGYTDEHIGTQLQEGAWRTTRWT